MESWIPGFTEVTEGPETTGLTGRYRGRRAADGAQAWIRIDGFPPNDFKRALLVARIYEATARLDHPDLPAVLAYGSTSIPGRPFIAFQEFPETRMEARSRDLDEAVEVLAELQLFAYECGLWGLHVPVHELERLREERSTPPLRLPFREFLADPRRPDGASSLAAVLPPEEWAPLTAPELRAAHSSRAVSVRQALTYRVAAQARYVHTGSLAEPAATRESVGAPAPDFWNPSLRDVEFSRPGRGPSVTSGPSALTAGLHPDPNSRPALEGFL